MTHPLETGASLAIDVLPMHLERLIKDQRDLEIQDRFNANVLEADWQSLVCQAHGILEGHTGHLSTHSPWNGPDSICPDRRVRNLVKTRLKQALEFAIALGATQWSFIAPRARAASSETIICAVGTSCREQIEPTTGRHALHPVEVVAEALMDSEL